MNQHLPPLVLLHTAEGNIATFTALLADLAPDIPVKHLLRDDLLKAAFAEGKLTDDIRQATSDALYSEARDGAGLVVCTCSTIGPGADDAHARTTDENLVPVLRIDRPMAEAAVTQADHIAVAATFGTTLEPTLDLVKLAAKNAGREPTIEPCLIEGAKELFEAGDMESYFQAIADGLQAAAESADLIVLAQASMVPALEKLAAPLPVPVLSSPLSGINRAIEAWQNRYR